jgi:hypothetical protein
VRSRARKNTGTCTDIKPPGADVLQFHAALKAAGGDPHKGDAVAVLRVDIGLHLEDKTGDPVQ